MLFCLVVLGFVGVSAINLAQQREDVYLRKVGEIARLHERLDQQQTAVDTLADGLDAAIFICDKQGSLRYANRHAKEMFRFDSIQGRTILSATLSYDLERLVLDSSEKEQALDSELSFSFPEERTGIARVWPEEDADRIFVSIYEITRLRRLERVRQDFVSNVSHELRTPLTLIRAMAETLLDEAAPTDEKSEKYLKHIMGEVDRLASLTNDLLILSSAESNPVRKQSCDIANVFRTVISQLRSKAEDKGLKLRYDGPSGSLMIEANMSQMTQVALNLIDNAINYSPSGEIVVHIQTGDPVRISVQDQGIGISSEHVPRIFERFYRIDKARSRSTGGTGLGLSIVKHIVESHGGTIGVDSNLNQGSTFWITLPIGD